MDVTKDTCIQKCVNFTSIDKKSFQKIINLREKSKGDKVYDDAEIDKESNHLLIFIKENLIAYSRLWPGPGKDVSVQRFSVSKDYRNNLTTFVYKNISLMHICMKKTIPYCMP